MVLEKNLVNTLHCQKDEQVNPRAIKPEVSLEPKMMEPGWSYFGHIMKRQDSLEKTLLGKVEGSKKRGRPKYEMD